jgi:hypothetical protein
MRNASAGEAVRKFKDYYSMGINLKKIEPPTVAGRRLALLICNGSFKNIPNYGLPGPAKDAERLEAVLSDADTCRFSVSKLLDAGLLEVRHEIARICADASEEDTLLIYYSGNGLAGSDGSLYLLVNDSNAEYPEATALDAEFVLSRLRNSKCRKIILMVDACYAGAFFNHNRGIPNGFYAITSCGADEICNDTPEGGAFSLALCAGLRNGEADRDGDGLVSIDELHEYVKRTLRAQGYESTPQKWVWNVPEPIFVTAVPRHVFLSYAREDKVEVDRLAQALQAEGLSVWIDRKGIKEGNWKERVTNGLNRARAVVVLLSPSSFASIPVRKELAFADNKKVPIIPLQLGEIPDEIVPDWFTLDYYELHRHIINAEEYDDGVKELVSAICNIRKPNSNDNISPAPAVASK